MIGVVELGNTTSVKLHIDEILLDIRKIQKKSPFFYSPPDICANYRLDLA